MTLCIILVNFKEISKSFTEHMKRDRLVIFIHNMLHDTVHHPHEFQGNIRNPLRVREVGLFGTDRLTTSQMDDESWWHHQMETFSTLLAICAGNSLVTGEFPAQRPVMRGFDVFFDLRLNKWLSKQWWGWWFEMPSCPLWRHCNCGMKTIPIGTNCGWGNNCTLKNRRLITTFINTFQGTLCHDQIINSLRPGDAYMHQ